MRPLHWLFALLGACSIHLAMAYGFVYHGANPVDSTIGADEVGVRIQLGMQGASLASEVIQTPEDDKPPQAAPEPPPVKPPAKIATATEPEAKQPSPEIKPVVVNVAKVEPPANAVLIQMEKKPEDTYAATFSAPAQTGNSKNRTMASTSRQLEHSSDSGAPGSQSVQQTAAYATARSNYFAHLMGTLQRNKRYPKEAKKKKEQGTVLVQFSINKRGEVLAANIVESSGHALLDDSALQMLRKASPLPSIPDSLGQQSLEITIPVEYSLITK